MRYREYLTIAACGFALTGGTQLKAADPSAQELLDEVRALRSEVKDLRARLDEQEQKNQKPLTDAEIAKVTDEVMKDAQERSKAQAPGEFTAAYVPDRGVIIRSADGNYLLHPWAFIQVRGTASYREDTPGQSGSDSEYGFEVPRLKFILDGNVFSPETTYQFIWATNDTTGNLGLQDAWVRHHFLNTDFAVRGGQIRDPLDHEQLLFGTKTMTPERSIVNNVLLNGDGIVKGVSLEYHYDDPNAALRGAIAFTSGQRNFDTTFQSFPTNSADWGAAARGEWKLMGDWKDYTQFTSLNDKTPLLVFGAGADFTQAGDTGALTHVVDAQYNLPNGLSLYGAYLGRYVANNSGLPNTNGGATGEGNFPDTYDTTFRVMAAWLFQQRFEPFVRYEYIDFDADEFPSGTPNHVVQDITLGFNYYLHGHRAKFSAAASYLPDGSPVGSTLGDILITDGGSEFLLQAQFQLVL